MNNVYLETRKHIVKAGHTAIMAMLDHDIPSSPEEIGFMMEALTDIAVMLDDSVDKITKLDVTYEQGCCLWHSCNVAILNNLYHTKNDKMHMMELMSLLAPRLDGEVNDEDIAEDISERSTGEVRPQILGADGRSIPSSGDSENVKDRGLLRLVPFEEGSGDGRLPDERESGRDSGGGETTLQRNETETEKKD